MDVEQRPDPDMLLANLRNQEEETLNKKGKLKIFFGYSAGVGKTYTMLEEAQVQYKRGTDVLVGYIEPHTRPETMALMEGLPMIKSRMVKYKNMTLWDFDLDKALEVHPELILVDELAHTNPPGSRNKKRYQDIEELINAGIDVYTTVNVQHIESLNDVVGEITKIAVQERIPDYFLDTADKVMLVDIDPDELMSRFEEGKIYTPQKASLALEKFFTYGNLTALREIAMRRTADRITRDAPLGKNSRPPFSKILVCVGPAPSSAHCIRTTARMAEAFHCHWVALYVKSNRGEFLTPEEEKNLQNNMNLAEELGAEIVTMKGGNIAMVVSEYAKLSGITDVVVGKTGRDRFLKNLFHESLEDHILFYSPDLEIHIIPQGPGVKPFGRAKSFFGRRVQGALQFSWLDTLGMLGVLVLTTIISLTIRGFDLGERNIIMLYILSVLVVSRITKGYLYGIGASILGVLTFNFIFVEPFFTFNTIDPSYPVTFIIMLIVALVTSALTNGIKIQAKVAVEGEQRTEVLYTINQKLLATRGLTNIVNITNDFIVEIFKRSVIFYTEKPQNGVHGIFKQEINNEDDTYLMSKEEEAVAYWVFLNGKPAGKGTDTLVGAGAYYVPVKSQGTVLGVIGIACHEEELSPKRRSFLKMIINQVAMAIERQRLSDKQSQINFERERERMRSNFLRAISHDLRTPLTGILGASSALLENIGKIDEEKQKKLLTDIKEDSQWIIQLVENLLSVTRIGEGAMNLNKTPEALEEVVAGAVAMTRKRYEGVDITVKVPEDVVFVPMDGTLIEQVLINLLENAVKYGGAAPRIKIEVKKLKKEVSIGVSENGPGISESILGTIFEGYPIDTGKKTDAKRGMGIGLSICQSIVKAHNGSITAENKKNGGALFVVRLPLNGDE